MRITLDALLVLLAKRNRAQRSWLGLTQMNLRVHNA